MKQFYSKFGFTSRETAIILTLLISFGIGLIIKYSGWKRPEDFSYSEPDKQFEEITRQTFDKLREQKLSEIQLEKSEAIKKAADSLLLIKENQPKKIFKFDKKININQAFAADLMMLPGIGEIMAERIVDYREENKGFKKIEDLMNVKGIGEKKFEKLRDYITIE